MAGLASPLTPPHERSAARLLPALVLVVLVVTSVVAFGVTRRVVAQQEEQLLAERADEVAALLDTSISNIESSLRVLGSVAEADSSGAIFVDAAEALVPNGSGAIFAVRSQQGSHRVIVGVGDGPQSGSTLDDARSALAARALEAGGFVGDLVDSDRANGKTLALALAVGDVVVFQESVVRPDEPAPSTEDSPFNELRVALYAAPTTDADRLIVTTEDDVPLTGAVERNPFEVGEDTWTLAIGARRPLVGSFAGDASWIILGVGLIAAALAGAVAEVLARRRSYAMALVATRTVDLREAQQAADVANRAKSEFLSRMSHELRTPLNAVLGFGQLLELDELTAEQRDSVEHIIKGGQHLLQLINEVLDISRVETGDLALSPEAVLVADLLGESLDMIRPLAEQRGIQIAVDRTRGWEEFVLADRQRTKQVLLNLLSNAVKYNRQRGTVAISSEVIDAHRVRLRVADTGPGIRPEDIELLFTPFQRLGAEQSDVEGTGIGLALSKRLAEAMGGTLGVDSTPGQGSTFWLDIPRVEGPVERYERLNGGASFEPAPSSDPRRTVLHIEDNLSNLTLVERILAQRPDVEIVAAMQGRLGLELAHQHQPALILLDLHLPDMNGEQVLQRLRDDPVTASTPVAIVSADATPGQVQRLLAAGAVAYLTKPIEVRDLLRVLDDALARR